MQLALALRLLLVVLSLLSTSGGHAAPSSEAAVVDGPVHNGVELAIDLPGSQHVKNIAAPADGAGLCVFASLDMAARWHHVTPMIDLLHKIQEGGGWPEKVDKVLKSVAPATHYEQYEWHDPAILDAAIARRSPPCVTYGYGERYGQGQTIAHMVILLHIDDHLACVLDNNFPQTYEWMSRAEFLRRWVHPSGKGWAVVLLESPPPPIPRSAGS